MGDLVHLSDVRAKRAELEEASRPTTGVMREVGGLDHDGSQGYVRFRVTSSAPGVTAVCAGPSHVFVTLPGPCQRRPALGDVLAVNDHLAALQARADALEAFGDAERQARAWIGQHGTDALVAELRAARGDRRRISLGTINSLVLLEHIDRLEAELVKAPVRKP